MAVGRHHILVLPKGFIALRILQLVTAVAILGLAAYGIHFVSFDGIDLTMFTAIATMIITVYIIVAEFAVPVIYNYWAILGLDIFAVIFWIISFPLLASEVADFVVFDNYNNDYTCSYYIGDYCVYKRSLGLSKRFWIDSSTTYRNAMAAAAGLGGLEFILFVISLVFTGIWLHRHRKAGGHCMPNSTAAQVAGPATSYPVEPKVNPDQGEYPPQGAYAPPQQPAYPQETYNPAPGYQQQQSTAPELVHPEQQ